MMTALLAKTEVLLEKVADATGSIYAVILAALFLVGSGLGNVITGGRLDPNFQVSNWTMNGVGFLMLFVLAAIGKAASQNAQTAQYHAEQARIHAATASQHAEKIVDHLQSSAT